MFKNAMKYGGIILGKLEDEIKRRRTFAIISHPDAGKTTLTEKFLLYGGAIAQAGAVRGDDVPHARGSGCVSVRELCRR